MASPIKHKLRSKRRNRQAESTKNWFFTECAKFTYTQSQLKGGK